jgi:hypothetical protein
MGNSLRGFAEVGKVSYMMMMKPTLEQKAALLMPANTPTMAPPPPRHAQPTCAELLSELMGMIALDPQPRGYAFESFLTRLFGKFGLAPRGGFRTTGEQIDGSFVLAGQTYLVEAKWKNDKTPAADLLSFQGKVGNRLNGTRGLFISYSGFTDVGLFAFGRGGSVICMDGTDLSDSLRSGIPFDLVIEQKVRRASETGEVYSTVCDLFSRYTGRFTEGRELHSQSDKRLLVEFREIVAVPRVQWLRDHHFGNPTDRSHVSEFERINCCWQNCEFEDFELRAPFERVKDALKLFAHLTWTYLLAVPSSSSVRFEIGRARISAEEAEKALNEAAIQLANAIDTFLLVSDKLIST